MKPIAGALCAFFERDIDRVKGLAFYDLTVLLTNIAMTAAMLVYLFATDWRLALVVAVIHQGHASARGGAGALLCL